MTTLENGSYDEIVAHLERDLELNVLEESDDLPMASMTSSTTKPKTLLSTGRTTDIVTKYCKEKGHMVKDCEKKNKKMRNKTKLLRKRHIPNVGLVARLTTRKKDIGKGWVRISNRRAPDPRPHQTVIQLQRCKNLSTTQHQLGRSFLLSKTTQKTSFATTPILPTSVNPTIHQIGPSIGNFP